MIGHVDGRRPLAGLVVPREGLDGALQHLLLFHGQDAHVGSDSRRVRVAVLRLRDAAQLRVLADGLEGEVPLRGANLRRVHLPHEGLAVLRGILSDSRRLLHVDDVSLPDGPPALLPPYPLVLPAVEEDVRAPSDAEPFRVLDHARHIGEEEEIVDELFSCRLHTPLLAAQSHAVSSPASAAFRAASHLRFRTPHQHRREHREGQRGGQRERQRGWQRELQRCRQGGSQRQRLHPCPHPSAERAWWPPTN